MVSRADQPDEKSSNVEKPKRKRRRRDDAYIRRPLQLEVGSEHEIGARLIEILIAEGDGHDSIVFAEGTFWEYRKSSGLWSEVPHTELRKIIGSFDGQEYPAGKVNKKIQVGATFSKGAIEQASVIAEIHNFFSDLEPVLAFTNGVVRVTAAGEIEFLPHSPERRVRVGYSFPYDPTATCPRFEQMMTEHFEGDVDAKEKILCEKEFFGACLFGIATTYQKCLALPSDGGSGRSTLLETVEAAFPTGTVSHIDVKDLRSAERRTRLVGRRLNYSDEVPPDAFIESEDFKKVVTGNIVTAEGKYRASFEYRPIAGHVFPIQQTASAELTVAFFRRFIIIRYNRTFEGDARRELNLSQRIIETELPGIVKEMIDGCARLRRQGSYTVPESHHKEVQHWRMDADTVMNFVATTCVKAVFKTPKDLRQAATHLDRHDWTSSSTLYTQYLAWCGKNGHSRPVSSSRFGERLKKLGIPWSHTNKGAFYAVTERVRAETREKMLANRESREPNEIPWYFDSAPFQGYVNGAVQGPSAPVIPLRPPPAAPTGPAEAPTTDAATPPATSPADASEGPSGPSNPDSEKSGR
jgi:phage/plasmid-associated DNA primase